MFEIRESPTKSKHQNQSQIIQQDDQQFKKISFSSFQKLKHLIHDEVTTANSNTTNQTKDLCVIKQLSQQEEINQEQLKVSPFMIEQNNKSKEKISNYNQIKHYTVIKNVEKWIKKLIQLRIFKDNQKQILTIQELVLLLVCMGYIKSLKKNVIIDKECFRKIMNICIIYEVSKYNGFYIKNIINLLCIAQNNYKPYPKFIAQYRNEYGQFDQNHEFHAYRPQNLNIGLQLKIYKEKLNKNKILEIKKIIDKQIREHILNQMNFPK